MPEPSKELEQTVTAPDAAVEAPVKKTQRKPAAAKKKAPAKATEAPGDAVQTDSSPKKQEAPAVTTTTAHPASLGRSGNDPRNNPGKQSRSAVLQPGVAKSAAPSPLTTSRTVAESHPSLVGRISNDPRSAGKPTDKV